jgi:hypothetical protein
MQLRMAPSPAAIKAKFKECFEIFSTKCFQQNGEAISCKLISAFCSGDERAHNCLGCNFSDSTELILRYLKKFGEYDSVQDDFKMYILLLYLLVERIQVILEVIQIPESYKEKHFKVFQLIRKWANFTKHPKAFILTHHPLFDFDDSGSGNRDGKFSIIIDSTFVDRYYKGASSIEEQKKTNKELFSKIANAKDVLVLYPDIARLTDHLSYSYNKFIELILKNEVFVEMLQDQTTLVNYFENQE